MLPDADVYIARAVFIHLSNRKILSILNLIPKGSFLLASGSHSLKSNAGRGDEDYHIDGRSVNPAIAPFDLELHPMRGSAVGLQAYRM